MALTIQLSFHKKPSWIIRSQLSSQVKSVASQQRDATDPNTTRQAVRVLSSEGGQISITVFRIFLLTSVEHQLIANFHAYISPQELNYLFLTNPRASSH